MTVIGPNDPTPQSVEFRLGSKRVRITGGATILIVMLAAALSYVIWTNNHAVGLLFDHLDQRSFEHTAILNELRANREEQSYILTLDQARRDQLRDRLHVPERFR